MLSYSGWTTETISTSPSVELVVSTLCVTTVGTLAGRVISSQHTICTAIVSGVKKSTIAAPTSSGLCPEMCPGIPTTPTTNEKSPSGTQMIDVQTTTNLRRPDGLM